MPTVLRTRGLFGPSLTCATGTRDPVCAQAPNDGTLIKGKEEEYLICAREERAKPIGDRRAGRRSPFGAGAEAGRGQKGRAAFPVDRSWKRRNRRQKLRRV